MMLLMYDAGRSRLLEMMRRWRTLLRVVGMMLHRCQLSAIVLSRGGKCAGKM